MKVHPLAQIIPPLTADEIERLEESLKQGYDVMKPIVTLDGMILDGRHRHEIAARLGVEPTYVAWVPAWDGDTPAGFVARSIIHRSLTSTQRATIAAEMMPHLEREAEKKMKKGKADPEEKVPQGRRAPQSRAVAAKAAGTNEKYVEVAAKAKAEKPETFEAMKAGKVSMAEAKKAVAPARKPPPPRDPAVPAEAAVALARIPEFKALINSIRAAKKECERLANVPGGEELAIQWRSIEGHLNEAAERVKFAAPRCVCPYMPNCEVGCKTCRQRKWVSRSIFDHLPPAIKEGIKVEE